MLSIHTVNYEQVHFLMNQPDGQQTDRTRPFNDES